MKPLVVLLTVFIISLIFTRMTSGHFELAMDGRFALSAMLLLTASGHFMFIKGMKMMIPPLIPFKTEIVLITGIAEIIAAVAIHIPAFRTVTGWFLIIFFVLLLPANIRAASKKINVEKATPDGPGLNYLWFRIPLQLVFICWTYFSVIAS